jgi:hypothetical protein
MMANVIDIVIRLMKTGSGISDAVGELNGLQAQTASLAGRLSSMGDSLMGAGMKMTLATAPLAALGTVALKAAADDASAMAKVQVVFGSAASSVQKFATTSVQALGMSDDATLTAVSNFGAFFTAMGVGQTQAAGMSTKLVQLSADVAAYNHISTAEAADKLTSGLQGVYRSLKDVNVIMSESEVNNRAVADGMATSTDSVSEAAAVTARYELLMEKTSLQQGYLASHSDTLAASTNRAKAELDNAAASLGTALIPLAVTAAQKVADLATAFTNLGPATQNTILTVGAVALAAGPVMMGIGGITKAAGLLITVFAGIKATAWVSLALGVKSAADAMALLQLTLAPVVKLLSMPLVGIGAAFFAVNGGTEAGPSQTEMLAKNAPEQYKGLAGWLTTPQQNKAGEWKAPIGATDISTGEPAGGWEKFVKNNQALVDQYNHQTGQVTTDTQKMVDNMNRLLSKGTADATTSAKGLIGSITLTSAILDSLTSGKSDEGLATTITELGNAAMLGPLSDAQMEKWKLLKQLLDLGDASALKFKDDIAALGAAVNAPGGQGSSMYGGTFKGGVGFPNSPEKKASPYLAFGGQLGSGALAGTSFATVLDATKEKDKLDLAAIAKTKAANEKNIQLAQTAAEQAVTVIQAKFESLANAISSAIDGAKDKAKGLFDLGGGNGPGGIQIEPGKNGPFEAMYRITDIAAALAKNKPGADTAKWEAMYGGGLAKAGTSATEAATQFQAGNLLAPGVFENIDWAKLGEQAATGLKNANISTYAGQAAAGLTAAGQPLTAENLRSAVEQLAAKDVGIVPSLTNINAAIAAAGGTSHTDFASTIGAINNVTAAISGKSGGSTGPAPVTISVIVSGGVVQVTGNGTADQTDKAKLVGETVALALKAMALAESRQSMGAPTGLAGAR